jgi:hypothetical protein
MRLFSIIPRLAPLIDGIGDYALSLAQLLRETISIDTHFIVTDPAWMGTELIDGFNVTHLSARSTGELLSALPADDATVLLHYEGYGYATRGCPLWLVSALEQWRVGDNRRRLVTMFHELYATGPPWTSAFWLSAMQRKLMTRLARLSDQWMTSLERYAATVRRLSLKTTARAYSLPVFSSIGEPVATPSLAERRRCLVVFGTRGRRIEVYKRSSADLNRICERLGITEILDIGRFIEFDFAGGLHVPVKALGELPGSEVSRLLLDAVAGVIDYPASMLGKSTIFAAYCSHRLIPILATYGDSTPADGLQASRHYWLTNVESEQLSLDVGQETADHAFAWYQNHNLAVHAKTFAACLAGDRHPAIKNAQGQFLPGIHQIQ